MNTTTESKTPGQIAFEIRYKHVKPTLLWENLMEQDQKDWLIFGEEFIASLPRAGVRVLTFQELRSCIPYTDAGFPVLAQRLMLNRLNALLSSTPTTELTKPKQEWDELPQGTFLRLGDQYASAIGWLNVCIDDVGHESGCAIRRLRQPRQSPPDADINGESIEIPSDIYQVIRELGTAKDLTVEQVLKQAVSLYQLQHHETIHGKLPSKLQESGERETPALPHGCVEAEDDGVGEITLSMLAYQTLVNQRNSANDAPDALCLQLANAMLERDKMNAERDLALEEVKRVVSEVKLSRFEELVALNNERRMQHELTASQAELVKMNENRDSAVANFDADRESNDRMIKDLTDKFESRLAASQAKLAEVKDRLMGALFDKEQAINKQAELIGECESLTAKLKAAEEKYQTLNEQWNAQSNSLVQVDQVNDELRATISRLEGELKNVQQCEEHFSAKWRENETELASLKSKPGGRLTVEDLLHVFDLGHEGRGIEGQLEYINNRLAPSWLPISTPPRSADADRNGNVEWLVEVTGMIFCAAQKGGHGVFTHWRHTNLPDLPVEKEDGFAGIMRRTHPEILPGSRGWELHQATWIAAIASVEGEK